jgi:hypothetical protein
VPPESNFVCTRTQRITSAKDIIETLKAERLSSRRCFRLHSSYSSLNLMRAPQIAWLCSDQTSIIGTLKLLTFENATTSSVHNFFSPARPSAKTLRVTSTCTFRLGGITLRQIHVYALIGVRRNTRKVTANTLPPSDCRFFI